MYKTSTNNSNITEVKDSWNLNLAYEMGLQLLRLVLILLAKLS